MHEILRNLGPESQVLDLGCDEGSFPAAATRAKIVRVDREARAKSRDGSEMVIADAARLPFRDGCFSALISNHSLEHFENLGGALAEMGRVVGRSGAMFVAVPDATTLTDRLYRWLAHGGGHVNAFTSEGATASLIAKATGLPHVATRVLYSSLSFLNRHNARERRPRRLLFLGGGSEWSLYLYAWVSRRLDEWFGTRWSVYGWAFYLGSIPEPVNPEGWSNTCLRCGSAHPAQALKIERGRFRCPLCGTRNPFFERSGKKPLL